MWKKTGLIIIYLCAGNKTLLFEFEFGFYKMNLSNLSVEFHNCDVIFESQFDQKKVEILCESYTRHSVSDWKNDCKDEW